MPDPFWSDIEAEAEGDPVVDAPPEVSDEGFWDDLPERAAPEPEPDYNPSPLPAVPRAPAAPAYPPSGHNYASDIQSGIDAAVDRYALPPEARAALQAIVETESSWGQATVGQPVVSHGGDRARGPFQFMSSTPHPSGLFLEPNDESSRSDTRLVRGRWIRWRRGVHLRPVALADVTSPTHLPEQDVRVIPANSLDPLGRLVQFADSRSSERHRPLPTRCGHSQPPRRCVRFSQQATL